MVTDQRWGIINCPKSRLLGSSTALWDKVEKRLKFHGVQYDFVQSESTGSVDRLVKMLLNNGYKTIIIVGGDSALNDAVNSIMQMDVEKRQEVSLGVIPNGLMNDFAKFWDIDENRPEQTVDWLVRHRVRKIDLGCIRYKNKEGDACRRYFLNCINMGLVASIMNLKRFTRHWLLGSRTLSFVSSFILMIFQRLESHMKLKINADTIDRKVMTVCVGNALGYGQTPNAVPYNGLLDVSVVYHPKMAQLFEGFYLFVRGKFLNHRSVHPYRTREVKVLDVDHALVSVDGRLMRPPVGEFSITVEQEVINFLIPV